MKMTNIDMDDSSSHLFYGTDECSDFEMDLDLDLDSDVSSSQKSNKKRTRQNLSHLSPEEKLRRRKMKNRIAAQSARDRKKAKMELLATKVAKLSKETMNLSKQMKILQRTNATLMEENRLLRSQLNQSGQTELPHKEPKSEVEILSSPVVSYCPVESEEDTRAIKDSTVGLTSTEGEEPNINSLDDAIRLLVDESDESEQLLDWLEQCSKKLLGSNETSSHLQSSSRNGPANETQKIGPENNSHPSNSEKTEGVLADPTTSLIDHVYSLPESTQEVVPILDFSDLEILNSGFSDDILEPLDSLFPELS